jgi:hypothetical protein
MPGIIARRGPDVLTPIKARRLILRKARAKKPAQDSCMAEQMPPVEPQRVPCEVCLKEVPKSEAAIAEARDYVAYFCGLECYEKWRRERAPVETGS